MAYHGRIGRLLIAEGQPLVLVSEERRGWLYVRLLPTMHGPIRLTDGRRLIGAGALKVRRADLGLISSGLFLKENPGSFPGWPA